MSELAVIDTNNYAAMAQMMGMAYDAGEKKSKVWLSAYQGAEEIYHG